MQLTEFEMGVNVCHPSYEGGVGGRIQSSEMAGSTYAQSPLGQLTKTQSQKQTEG